MGSASNPEYAPTKTETDFPYLRSSPHTATLRSLGRSQVCSVEREAFEGLVEEDPWLVYRVMQNTVQESQDILRRMNAQYAELTQYVHRTHAVF